MTLVCFHGPLRDEAVLSALFDTLPATVPGHVGAGRLTGGDCVVPGLGTGEESIAVKLVEADPSKMDQIRFVTEVLGLREGTRSVMQGTELQTATTFEPVDATDENWLDAEAPGWAQILVEAIPEIRSYGRDHSVQETAGRLTMVLARAAARATAKAAQMKPAESGFGLKDVVIHNHSRPYSNYFAVEEFTYSHVKFDGTMSEPVLRAVFMAADAVTVLPYDPVRDAVLLVEQVRAGPIACKDPSAWVLEPVAGRIEPGDGPETTARKEAEEEAGLSLQDLHFIADYYPSTGCFSEFLYSYIGIADLPETAAGLGGVLAEGEDIRAHIMPRSELLARIDRNEIPDGPLLISAWWLERNLSRLRGGC